MDVINCSIENLMWSRNLINEDRKQDILDEKKNIRKKGK